MQTPSIEIRALQPLDWKIFKDLRIQSVSQEPTAFLATEAEIKNLNDSYWIQASQEFEKSLFVFIAFDTKIEKAVGQIGVSPLQNQKNQHVAKLFYTYVQHEYRGHGIAQQLLAEAVETAQKLHIKILLLELFETQQQALTLYRKSGFVISGSIPNFFQVTTATGTKLIGKIEMYKEI